MTAASFLGAQDCTQRNPLGLTGELDPKPGSGQALVRKKHSPGSRTGLQLYAMCDSDCTRHGIFCRMSPIGRMILPSERFILPYGIIHAIVRLISPSEKNRILSRKQKSIPTTNKVRSSSSKVQHTPRSLCPGIGRVKGCPANAFNPRQHLRLNACTAPKADLSKSFSGAPTTKRCNPEFLGTGSLRAGSWGRYLMLCRTLNAEFGRYEYF